MKKDLKLQKFRHKYFYDDIYKVHFIFLLNVKDDKHVEETLKKHYKHTYEWYKKEEETMNVSIENCWGKNVQGLHRQLILVKYVHHVSESEFISCLVHECLHAVMDVFKQRGVKYDEKSYNEHYTYYLETIVQKALTK